MAVAHLHTEPRPQPLRPLAPVIPLRPEQRMADDEAHAGWDALVTAAYAEHRDLVLAEATRVLRDADLAEDVVQEVFTRLWRRPGAFDPDRGSLRAYLRTVARGRSIDLLRSEVNRRDRQTRVAGDEMVESFEDTSAARATVRSSVAALPASEREVVARTWLADRSYREVADDLDLPEGTVKTRMRSAFGRLRETASV
jgi:RNA polymerase sigma factor (sigma-70 family)